MKLSKYINFKAFLISFAIGLLYIYLTDDYKKVIVVYPTPMNTNKKGGPIWQSIVEPDQVRCTRPIKIDKDGVVGFLPKDLALTKEAAKKRHFKDEEWDSPDEEWAEAREENGGNKDIKSWPGSGDKLRMITYPGTTNHEDILSGSKYARYMREIHRKTRHFCSGENKRLKWNNNFFSIHFSFLLYIIFQ